ncbi:hypothetical protein P3T86_13995 (plasmid) [Staphylococcus nepalensis]|uniref:hypothetical protein n=1 Tax=Staphylococcus nepalensis TaxID=214473 RepID=UPI002B263C91|nr:hypothetical protein [Staphylococcus nepalensis]WQL21591.1 hypothetical protein P3T86_13995 [Staphylococcus nepalensis]
MNKLTVTKKIAYVVVFSLLSVFVTIVYFKDKKNNRCRQIKIIHLKTRLISLRTKRIIDRQYDFRNMSNKELKTINLALDDELQATF